MLRIVRPRAEQRYVDCVPLVPLKAAAGAFSEPQNVRDGEWDWVEVDSHRSTSAGNVRRAGRREVDGTSNS